MKANTRFFGEIEIEDDKIITIEKGMIGFPELKKFALIFNEEKGKEAKIMWLQSMEEEALAFPVMRPELVKEDYNPTVNDELFQTLGEMTPEDTYVLVTVTVPKDVKEASANLKAPIVINTATMKGCQIIVEDDYPVKYKLNQNKKAGE
ncbi:MAG: flagellar assembly protein FliW [Roseburia sp.]|uniref:flagellar assembly protein FliW n=1 Tax=Roseburia sp. 831b TaxID=1261635 RepID=UPI000950BC95|nr:flagellar assembly protein FliW [Roseburia sp. 831b]MCI5919970.1 flagellar assembly protein FliW [Roseburia sp.]MDD6217635.1 flagellar assembly protein FliW [Roseburia sp.]MDY5882473.1 flagellar assembly protein FliW [Roseburia sp.]WVK72806.1 flagellar assembly protein FliW [Roseburia sp. 831b]